MGFVLSAIFVPACVMLVFSLIQKKNTKVSKRMSDDKFTVLIPEVVSMVGMLGVLTMTVMMLCFTIFSEEPPHMVFYIILGSVLYICVYQIVRTYTFRVVVRGNVITVHTAFRKPYSFTLDEIVSAVRQVKNNLNNSERIVIKTNSRKKLIVESLEISYGRFLKKIQSEVDQSYLVGFH